jgi:hypothetical protein
LSTVVRERSVPSASRASAAFREVTADRLDAFLRRGFHQRHFFAHRVRYLRRPGSDGQVLAARMYSETDPSALRQVVVHASGAALDELPAGLFFDRDLVWHQQHLGLPGHVAAANLIVRGGELLTTARYADIVQRISRRRDVATRVERHFRGWDHMLLNAVFGYAVEQGLRRIVLPNAETALRNTDRRRSPGRPLFARIYDDNVRRRFRAQARDGFWTVDVADNMDRWVEPERRAERLDDSTSICICHDTERELGHLDADPAFAVVAAGVSARNLDRMLETEGRRGVRGTYAVVGRLMGEVRAGIESRGHEVAFHSWDHDTSRPQLLRCREYDYRIPGYRVPKSEMTSELNDRELAMRNFEWLASSPRSLLTQQPLVRAGIVRMPVRFDDFPMYKTGVSWPEWESTAVASIRNHQTTVFGLHDCYAHLWLDRYDDFLARLADLGRLRTIGQIADELFLQTAE